MAKITNTNIKKSINSSQLNEGKYQCEGGDEEKDSDLSGEEKDRTW